MLETKILTVSLHPMVIGKRLKQAESECGVAARYRIVKDARRGSHLIICLPRRKNFTIFHFEAMLHSMDNNV